MNKQMILGKLLLPLAFTFSGATSVSAQNLAGTWNGRVTCGGQYLEAAPWPITLVLTPSSGGVYSVAASMPNAQGTGRAQGNSISFTASNFLNSLKFSGNIAGARMSGRYTQSGSGPCSWTATKVGGVSGGTSQSSSKKDRDPGPNDPQACLTTKTKLKANRVLQFAIINRCPRSVTFDFDDCGNDGCRVSPGGASKTRALEGYNHAGRHPNPRNARYSN